MTPSPYLHATAHFKSQRGFLVLASRGSLAWNSGPCPSGRTSSQRQTLTQTLPDPSGAREMLTAPSALTPLTPRALSFSLLCLPLRPRVQTVPDTWQHSINFNEKNYWSDVGSGELSVTVLVSVPLTCPVPCARTMSYRELGHH